MKRLKYKARRASLLTAVVAICCLQCSLVDCLSVGRPNRRSGVVSDKNVTILTEVGGNEEVLPSANGTRTSRQLWSTLQNVIKLTKESSSSNSGSNRPGGTLGAIASSFIGNLISTGINSNIGSSLTNSNPNQHFQQHPYHDEYSSQPSILNPPTNPNDYMHYLLLNSQANQHTSVPHYQQQQQIKHESTSDLIEKYKEQMTSSSSSIGESDSSSGGGGAGVSGIVSTGNQILSKLALGSILDDFDLENFSNFLSFGSFEKMVDKVNKFDKLKCIPRLLCQMVAKRQEDARLAERTSTTTSTTTTRRPKRRKSEDDDDEDAKNDSVIDGKRGRDEVGTEKEEESEKNKKGVDEKSQRAEESDDDEDGVEKQSKEEESQEDNDNGEDDTDDDAEDDESEEKEYTVIKEGRETSKREGRRSGRIFKINGADTALEQFVKFLELMQLKDWSLYPYLNGAYQGHQVTRSEDCQYKFSSCPFSDDQLVYYFNNYNGGFFQSI